MRFQWSPMDIQLLICCPFALAISRRAAVRKAGRRAEATLLWPARARARNVIIFNLAAGMEMAGGGRAAGPRAARPSQDGRTGNLRPLDAYQLALISEQARPSAAQLGPI